MPPKKRKSLKKKFAKEKEALGDSSKESSVSNESTRIDTILNLTNETNCLSEMEPVDQPVTTDASIFQSTAPRVLNEIFDQVALTHSSSIESSVWKYAIKNENQTASCRICQTTIKTTNGSTTGVRKHLLQVHKIKEITSKKQSKAMEKCSPSLRRELHNLIIQAVVKDGRAFDDFRRAGIMKIFQRIVPGKFVMFLFVNIL